MKKPELAGGRPGEGGASEVDSAVQEANVEWLLAERQTIRGVESSTICQPSSGDDCGGLNRRRRERSKLSDRERGDAKVQIFPPG